MTDSEPGYLYGFARGPELAPGDVTGVFRAPVHTLADGDLLAVVSPLPGSPRLTRADLLAHSDVLQALLPSHDLVPVQLGTLLPPGFRLRDLPAGQRRSLHRAFDVVAGRVEYQLTGTYVADAVTRLVLEGDRGLRRMKTSARSGGMSAQLELGSRFARALDARRAADTDRLVKRLSRPTRQATVDPPAGTWGALKTCFLVDRRRQAQFETALADAADEVASFLTLSWLGPLPPYTFVRDPSMRLAG